MSDSELTVVSRSIQALRRLWIRCYEFLSWSNLAIYGNNPIVKLAILSPLIAQVIIHQDSIQFLEKYNFTNLGWLYAALMCFFAAQLIYSSFLCHRDIKDYPSEVKFTQAMEATMSNSELNCQYFDVYKEYFKRYGGAIDETKYDSNIAKPAAETMDINEMRKKFTDSKNHAINTKIEQQVSSIYMSIINGKQHKPIDWSVFKVNETNVDNFNQICDKFQLPSTTADGIRITPERKALFKMIYSAGDEFQSSHWRASAIKRHYTKLNLNRLSARLIAATLYAAGTFYFIYAGASNIAKVLVQYSWIEKLPAILSHL